MKNNLVVLKKGLFEKGQFITFSGGVGGMILRCCDTGIVIGFPTHEVLMCWGDVLLLEKHTPAGVPQKLGRSIGISMTGGLSCAKGQSNERTS